MAQLDAGTLKWLRTARTVRIETSRGREAPLHSTIIWVVVDESDRVFVRTYKGAGSRWYREALATGRCALVGRGSRRADFDVERADDAERIRACSKALRAKHAGDPALEAMLREEVLPTTLELTTA